LRLKKIIGEDSAGYSNNEMKEPNGSLNFSLESGDTQNIPRKIQRNNDHMNKGQKTLMTSIWKSSNLIQQVNE
jgi:hypothetical protein